LPPASDLSTVYEKDSYLSCDMTSHSNIQCESTTPEYAAARVLVKMHPVLSNDIHALTSLEEGQWLSSTAVELLLKRCASDSVRVLDPSYLSIPEPKKIITKSTLRLHGEDLLVIPLNHNNKHWTLAVMDVLKAEIEVYDSLGGEGHNHFRQATETLNRFTQFLYGRSSDWRITNVMCPQQANYHDCGVYVVVFAYYRILGLTLPDSIDSELWRKILRLSLMSDMLDEKAVIPFEWGTQGLDSSLSHLSPTLEDQRKKGMEASVFDDVRANDTYFEERLRLQVLNQEKELYSANESLSFARDIGNVIQASLEQTTRLHAQTTSNQQTWQRRLVEHKIILDQYHSMDHRLPVVLDSLNDAITSISQESARNETKTRRYNQSMIQWQRAKQVCGREHEQRSANAQEAQDTARDTAEKIHELALEKQAQLARFNEMSSRLRGENSDDHGGSKDCKRLYDIM